MTQCRLYTAILTVLLLAPVASARQRISGFCAKGGQTVTTSGLSSTSKVLASYPSCTVTVYGTGTVIASTIYSDNASTPKANPFTADAFGLWFFYADNGRYDVALSGAGMTGWTMGDILLADPASVTPTVTSFNARTGAVVPQSGDYTYAQISGTPAATLLPFLYSQNFVFTPQSPSSPSAIIVGNNLVTLTPVPPGVNWNNSKHYLYVGGTGTPEPCLIVSAGPGTATSGSASGTLTISCANTHSAGYTIQSATLGQSEAIWSLTSGVGGRIYLPSGTGTLHAPVSRRLLTPIWIEGMGMQATTLLIAADSLAVTANGNYDWSPGDALAVPVGGLSNVTIQYPQPDSAAGCPGACNVAAVYTQWKPAIYTAGTYHTEWRNIAIIAGWDGILIPSNTNGAYFENIYASCFRRLVSLESSFDSVQLINIHSSTTGLTANQGTAYLYSASPMGFYVGRADDLKIHNSTIGGINCVDFHPGTGGGPSVEITNLWCEGAYGQSDGEVRITNFRTAGSGSNPLISHSGGLLRIDQGYILYSGTGTAIASIVTRQDTGTLTGPLLSIANSYISSNTTAGYIFYCTAAAPFVGVHNCNLNNNLIVRSPAVYANAAIRIEAGTGSTRLNATGNVFSDIGGGSGPAIGYDTDTAHIFSNNNCGGYTYSLPATQLNLSWFGNINCASNIHRLHDATNITAKLSSSSFVPLQTENYIASETGANNALIVALVDAAGVNVPLAAGLKLTILLAHTVQVGANTIVFNGSAAKAIRKASSPATNLTVAKTVGAIITVYYDGTVFQDISQ